MKLEDGKKYLTTEEKVRELIEIRLDEEGNISLYSIESALELMAEWKDEQFVSLLSDIFDYFKNNIGLYDGGIDTEDIDKPKFIEEFTKRIIK